MKLNRNCECCKAAYSTGKDYGDAWCEIPGKNNEMKGLCEFCNPNNNVWFIPNKKCHATIK